MNMNIILITGTASLDKNAPAAEAAEAETNN